MKDRGRKLLSCIRRHFAGFGIAGVTAVMVFTVVKGVAGQEAGFDPDGIHTSFSTEFFGLPDKTGYDLSGEGEDSEEVNRDSGSEREEEKEESQETEEEKEEPQEESDKQTNLGLNEQETLPEEENERIILPDEMMDETNFPDMINATISEEEAEDEDAPGINEENIQQGPGDGVAPENSSAVQESGRKNRHSGGRKEEKPEENPSAGGDNKPDDENKPPVGDDKPDSDDKTPDTGEDKPSSGEDDPPGGKDDPPQGDGDLPGNNPEEETPPVNPDPEPPQDDGKVSIDIGGEKKEFDNEDDALAWIADNNGKNEDGKYFEGFTKDDKGNYVPSYTDKDKFSGNTGGDVIYDYHGDSGVFVAPEGTQTLDFSFASSQAREKIKTIVISKNVQSVIIGNGVSFPVLEKFVVSKDNPRYVSVDGALYIRHEDGTKELYMMPLAKKEVEQWADNLTVIGGNAFYHSRMERVEFPETVTKLCDEAFNESYVGTIVLPESIRSIGAFAFSFAKPEENTPASRHSIIVKAAEPPEAAGTTFYWMDYSLESKQKDPVTEIIVPNSDNDEIYEAYLNTWGTAIARRYGGDAGLNILKTENGVSTAFQYYEINGKGAYRRLEEEPLVYEDDLGVYYIDKDGKTTLAKCKSTDAFINLADSAIAKIGEGAFDGCTSMTGIRLPETLTAMPENIFARHGKLKVIISYAPHPPAMKPGFPETCAVMVRPEALEQYQEAWGDQARKILGTSETYTATASGMVYDTGNRRLLDVPVDMAQVTIISSVTSIYEGAFAGNTALESISIPQRITQIGEGAFAGCTNLGAVTWMSSAAVPESCFEGCTRLKTFLASGSGNSLTAIGRRAFYGCSSLGTVLYRTDSSGKYYYYYYLEEIGEEAFAGCASMTYAYLNQLVSHVGRGAFAGCTGLATVSWGAAAPIPESCFENCSSLQTVAWGDWPEKVMVSAVETNAFYGCVNLASISLPSMVEAIGVQAFDGREGNEITLTFEGRTPPEWDGPEELENFLIYVPDSQESDDAVYLGYLEQWKDWLGENLLNVLRTKDGAENRVMKEDNEEQPDTEELPEENKQPGAEEASEGDKQPDAEEPPEEDKQPDEEESSEGDKQPGAEEPPEEDKQPGAEESSEGDKQPDTEAAYEGSKNPDGDMQPNGSDEDKETLPGEQETEDKETLSGEQKTENQEGETEEKNNEKDSEEMESEEKGDLKEHTSDGIKQAGINPEEERFMEKLKERSGETSQDANGSDIKREGKEQQ